MDALMNVGEFVKATEFIGQSSGKAMKGQTQKVQQAVLEKFRAGGYNVIVATSIGEEGLDIMEVDLVICFDANISPLRMIQRMGRTGRKHDGRVVVLACEGSELKGYLRKQANSNAVKKHMRNGGINSFDFHPSPRMIPHVIKPEAQLVELSIECFVPRGKKVKDSSADSPKFMDKLSDAETELIMKYFHPSREDTWRPSLIAFPHFQAFPSRVHKIMHSFRTGMLIDTMQHLQGLSYSIDKKTFLVEGMVSSPHYFEAETVAQDGNDGEDLQMCHESTRAFSPKKIPDIEETPTEISSKEKDSMLGLPCQNVSVHHFVHETNFVSIDACGQVLIMCVPLLPSMEEGPCKDSSNVLCTELLSHMKQESSLRTSPGDCKGQNMCVEGIEDKKTQTRYMNDTFASNTSLYNSEPNQGQNMNEIDRTDEVERTIIEPSAAKRDLSNSEDTAGESPDRMVKKTPILELDDCNNDIGDTELSPRLTNMIKKGIVPESPIGDTPKYDMVCTYLRPNNETFVSHLNCHAGVIDGKICEKPVNPLVLSKSNERNEHIVPALVSLAKLDTCLSLMRSSSENHKVVDGNDSSSVRVGVSASSIDEEIHSPLVKVNNSVDAMGIVSDSRDIQEIHTPLGNLMSSSCSKDWRLNSGETSKTFKQAHKLRRLRKLGDPSWRKSSENVKEDVGFSGKNLGIYFSGERPSSKKQNRGKQKPEIDVRAFIEEEAEVSSEAEVSDDEEDKDDSSFDGSFIDDRINPTATSTQAEDKSDMMAIYRRSLLSQSPMVWQPNVSSSFSPDPQSTRSRATETENSSARLSNSFETPCTDIQSANRSSLRSSVSCQIDAVRISGAAIPDESNGAQREIESKMENRKRKLNFVQVGSIAVTSYEQEQSFHSKTANRISLKVEAQRIELNEDIFYDDQFYEDLDLDAVEAQATRLLRHKSESSLENNGVAANAVAEQNNLPTSPTFDLGI